MSTATNGKTKTGVRIVARYEYKHPDGKACATKVRTQPKDFRIDRSDGEKGKWPLYRCETLAALSPGTVIYIVEGEKDVLTLEGMKLTAVTPITSKGLDKTDWTPLERFNNIVVLGDNDKPGREFIQLVAIELAKLDGARVAISYSFPTLHETGDVSDFIEAGNTLDELQAIIEQYGEAVTLATTPPEPVQLFQPPPEREPFPTDALGAELAATVRQVAYCIGVTEAMTAQSILAGLSLVVQAHANVKIGSIEKPTSLYCLTIAESGSRKTTLDGFILRPHREWERRELLHYEEKMKDYKRQMRAYKKLTDKAMSGKTMDEIADKLKAIGDEPERPLSPSLIIANATTEALHYRLSEEVPYCGLFTSEGGTFIGGYSMNSDNVISTIAHFSELWDGGGGIRLRVEKGSSNTHGRRFAAHMMVQPGVASDLVESELIQNQGFLARMLVIEDESLRGRRTVVDEDITTKPEYEQYCQRMGKLLDFPPTTNDRGDELETGTITASPEAAALWWAYQQNIEQQLSPDGDLETIYPWANKAAEHGLRIAGNLAAFEDMNGLFMQHLKISEKVMARALCIADYYLKENLRFYESAKVSELHRDAQKLLEFLQQKKAEHADGFTLSYISQYAPYALRKNPEQRRAALDYLRREGLISKAKNKVKLL